MQYIIEQLGVFPSLFVLMLSLISLLIYLYTKFKYKGGKFFLYAFYVLLGISFILAFTTFLTYQYILRPQYKEEIKEQPAHELISTPAAQKVYSEQSMLVDGEKYFLEDAKDAEGGINSDGVSVIDSETKKYSIIYYESQFHERDCWLRNNLTKQKIKIRFHQQERNGNTPEWYGDKIILVPFWGQGYQYVIFYLAENPDKYLIIDNLFFFDREKEIVIFGIDKHQGLTDDNMAIQKIIMQEGIFDVKKQYSFNVQVPHDEQYYFNHFKVMNTFKSGRKFKIDFYTGTSICVDLDKLQDIDCAAEKFTSEPL